MVEISRKKVQQKQNNKINMSELKEWASSPAKRNGVISVKDTGALMVYVPYKLVGEYANEGIQSICIGKKDGTLQEAAIATLRKVFGWNTPNPYDQQRIPMTDSDEAEFQLAEWYNEPWTNKEGKEVNSWKFRWFNEIGKGIAPATDDEEKASLEKWGSKLEMALGSKPEAAAKKTEPEKAKVPARKAAAPAKKTEPRKSSPAEVMELLVKKHYPDGATEDQQQEIGDKYYFPAQDELFGVNVAAETPEDWGKVADRLGL